MLPLVEDFLRLEQIAELWSREHNRVRTSLEIYDELLSALWKNELIVFGGSGKSPVDRQRLLRVIRLCLEHPGFVIVESRDEIPVRATKHADGSVSVDATVYVVLPSDVSTWNADILEDAYTILATRSVTHFSELVRPVLLSLKTSHEALGAYCDASRYARPSFWFHAPEETRSFGGRPSVMRQIIAEMKRRAERGDLAPRLRDEAGSLLTWADQTIDEKDQIPQVRGIENRIRQLYKQLKAVRSADA